MKDHQARTEMRLASNNRLAEHGVEPIQNCSEELQVVGLTKVHGAIQEMRQAAFAKQQVQPRFPAALSPQPFLFVFPIRSNQAAETVFSALPWQRNAIVRDRK